MAHNGNLTNTSQLVQELQQDNFRHVNTDSDSEVLLNVFAESLTQELLLKSNSPPNKQQTKDVVFQAMETVMTSCQGGYAGLYVINGVGLVGFRDPHGIRPLVFGVRSSNTNHNNNDKTYSPRSIASEEQLDFCIASESVAIDTLGFKLVR